MIQLDALHLSNTYADWLLGGPTPEAAIISAKHAAIKMWGIHVPILVLDAPITERIRRDGTSLRLLPPVTVLARFVGSEIDLADDGTHLIVITFTDKMEFDIGPILARFVWADHAKGFTY